MGTSARSDQQSDAEFEVIIFPILQTIMVEISLRLQTQINKESYGKSFLVEELENK